MSIHIARPASPSVSLTDTADFYAAHFATRWPAPAVAVVSVQGELDAANAHEFADYALTHIDRIDGLVLDLSGVGFFGTAAFSALHNINVQSVGAATEWALVPSPAVTRLLKICDPDRTLPISESVESALAPRGEGRRLLQLVPESR